MSDERVETQTGNTARRFASKAFRGVLRALAPLNPSDKPPIDSNDSRLARRAFLAGSLALGATLLTAGRSRAQERANGSAPATEGPNPPETSEAIDVKPNGIQAASIATGPEQVASAETREQKTEAFMRRVVKEDKLPKPGEGKWSVDENPQRIKTIHEYSPEKDITVITSYLETPGDGQFLQEMVTIRRTNTPTSPVSLITASTIEETMGTYVKLGGDERMKAATWQFQRGGQNVAPRIERTLKDDESLVSEGAILYGANNADTGQFEMQVAKFSKKTLQYQQGSGFAGR